MTAFLLMSFLICWSVRCLFPGRNFLALLCDAMMGPWKMSRAWSNDWSQRCDVSRMMLCFSNCFRSWMPSGVMGPSLPVPVAYWF